MEKKLVSIKEAAEILDISRRNVKKLLRKRCIKAYKIASGVIRYDIESIEALKEKEGRMYKLRFGGMINRFSDFWRHNDMYIVFALIAAIIIFVIIKMVS